jgi:transforming growth factor-beta-induced protein
MKKGEVELSADVCAALLGTVPDLAQALSTIQNVTILAPSNDAFSRLMSRNPMSAQLMRDPRLLTGVLQYHVLMGNLPSSGFSTTPKFAPSLLTTPFANVTGNQKVELVKVNNTAMIFSGFKQMAMVVTAVCVPSQYM